MMLTLLFILSIAGQKETHVVVEPGDTPRALAEAHLGDPNLWPAILRANGLARDAAIVPGMRLLIPKESHARAHAALTALDGVIREATENGGGLFAVEAMSRANEAQTRARAAFEALEWPACAEIAERGLVSAREALETARGQRNARATALLHRESGTVQSLAPGSVSWQGIARGDALVERERVRTLSASRATIMLTDRSRIDLEANASALIRSLRTDRLRGRAKGSVSLIEGEVFALLGDRGRDDLDVEIPGLELDTASEDYWVSRRGDKTQVANFDQGALSIKRGEEEITLGERQGTSIEPGRPMEVFELLPAPEPLRPEDGQSRPGNEIRFSWRAVEGAVAYRFETAADAAFTRSVATSADLTEPDAVRADLEPGLVYWRVRARDARGMPGETSSVSELLVTGARGAPYLIVLEPEPGSTVHRSPVTLRGRTERGVRLEIGGVPVPIGEDGTFIYEQPLSPGFVEIDAVLFDEVGQQARRVIELTYRPDVDPPLTWSPDLTTVDGVFATREPVLMLAGETLADVGVTVVAVATMQVLGTTRSDAGGRFLLACPVSERDYLLKLETVTGRIGTYPFSIVRDTEPPVLAVDPLPPSYTSARTIRLELISPDALDLWWNGRPLEGPGPRHVIEQALVEGDNLLRARAVDAVGNVAIWSREVVRDTEPPVVLEATVSPERVGPREVLMVRVRVADRTGPRRTAMARVRIGARALDCPLRLIAEDFYRGTHLAETAGSVRLISVTLEDHLGNRGVHRLNEERR